VHWRCLPGIGGRVGDVPIRGGLPSFFGTSFLYRNFLIYGFLRGRKRSVFRVRPSVYSTCSNVYRGGAIKENYMPF